MWVKKAREAVKIPVIASLNAVERATWVDYARQLAEQGVDAIELNFFATPRDFDTAGSAVEEEQLRGGPRGPRRGEDPRCREAEPVLFQPSELHRPAGP